MSKSKRSTAFFLAMLTTFSVAIYNSPKKFISTNAASKILAFPGAVGVGKYSTGGRGGKVVHVTNLNDSGAGSFRDAVGQSNRIVVFDVSGTIELQSNVTIADNVTVAGQTAPGGSGITVKNYKIGLSGDNIICRYVSSRPGPYKSTSSGNDAWGGAKGSNSIIDHCSLSYATDEQWGLYSNNKYTTVQYSIIGPADSWGGHKKGIHGFGIMMPGTSTFDHNLILHNVSRNFRGKIGATETCDFTNNVIYNWGYQTAYGTVGHLNYVNNTLKIGPNTTGGYHYMDIDSSTHPENFKVYAKGNQFLNKDNSFYSDLTQNNWKGVTIASSLGISATDVKVDTPWQTYGSTENLSSVLNCESASDSYEHVVAYAGNGISSENRTDIDKQCAFETKTGTGTLTGSSTYDEADSTEKANISKYKIQCGIAYKYPSSVLKKTIVDSDNDGMADDWEIARGLNPKSASDASGDYCGQGYMNIEYYVNDLTVNSFPTGIVKISPVSSAPQPSTTTSATTTTKPVTTQPVTSAETVLPLNGRLIKNLTVMDSANAKNWSINENTVVGNPMYGDRDTAYLTLPRELIGCESIETACDSKNSTSDLAEFISVSDATVYIALDSRVTALPEWLKSWSKSDLTISNSKDAIFNIYAESVKSGERIILGQNGQSSGCTNYTVFIKDAESVSPLKGDINSDGKFDIADVVTLQHWILNQDKAVSNWKAGDFTSDDSLDAMDLSMMRYSLISK